MLYEVALSQSDSDLHDKIRTKSKVDHFYVESLKNIQEDRIFQQQEEYNVDESEEDASIDKKFHYTIKYEFIYLVAA